MKDKTSQGQPRDRKLSTGRKQPLAVRTNTPQKLGSTGSKADTPQRVRSKSGIDKENLPGAFSSLSIGCQPGPRRSQRLTASTIRSSSRLGAGQPNTIPENRKLENDFDSLQSQLHVLKRQSLRPSISGIPIPGNSLKATERSTDTKKQTGAQSDSLFQGMENCRPDSLAASAASLVHDESYRQLFDRGMNAQLQRTKDGATDRSRIKELAGDGPCHYSG